MRAWMVVLSMVGLGCALDTAPMGEAAAPADTLGKADSILDTFPTLAFDTPVTGDVGGDRSELYKMTLQRGDRIELLMTVTGGDLQPHLAFYRGIGTYVASTNWSQDDNVLRKEYFARDAGVYSIAAKVFRNRGAGDYTLEAGLPESFNVLIKELQSLCLNVELVEAVDAPAAEE